jgi:nucleoid-associated protein YgaU
MFNHTSRYHSIGISTTTAADGRTVSYLRRRFIPGAETMATLVEVTVTEADRLDLIAARVLGDPEQFWRIADANNAMDPLDLTAEPGGTLKVGVPQAAGLSMAVGETTT